MFPRYNISTRIDKTIICTFPRIGTYCKQGSIERGFCRYRYIFNSRTRSKNNVL